MMFAACPWMKPCGQQWWEKQQADGLCPHPKSVPGRPSLSRLSTPLYTAVNPSRLLLCPRHPKYSTAWPAVQLLAENSPKSCLQYYLMWRGQDIMVQTKPHSQTHAIGAKDIKTFALSQALLDVPCQNWQPNQVPILLSLLILQLGGTHPNSSLWTQAHLIPCEGRHLLKEGFGLLSSPELRRRGAGRDVILPVVFLRQTEVLPLQAIWHGPSY